MNVIGTAINQKPTGEDGSHLDGCRTAMWKERRNHHIMISKQQPNSMVKRSGAKFSGDKIVPQSDLRAGTASDRIIKKEVNRIATWNVRSLGVCGKLRNIKLEMKTPEPSWRHRKM